MTLINTTNVGGTDFGLLNSTVMGVCSTPAGSEVKACTFADDFELKAGVVVTIKFTYANTYGDGSTTYPKLSINGVTGAIRNASGSLASNGAWAAQALVPFIFDGTDFTLLVNPVTGTVSSDNAYPVSSKGVAVAVSAEATARTNADNGLSSDISAEATARANADNSLSSDISAEATARANADNSLSSSISNLSSAVSSAISASKSCKAVLVSEFELTGNKYYSYDEFSSQLCDYIGKNEGMVAMYFINDTSYTVSVSFGSMAWSLNGIMYIGRASKTAASSGGLVMFPNSASVYHVYYKSQNADYWIDELAIR